MSGQFHVDDVVQINADPATTTLVSDAAANDTVLKVTATTGFRVGDRLVILHDANIDKLLTITSIDDVAGVKQIGISAPLVNAHLAGAIVSRFTDQGTITAVGSNPNTITLSGLQHVPHAVGEVIHSLSDGLLLGVFRSADGGGNWAAMTLPTTKEGSDLFGPTPGDEGKHNFSIAADPNDENVVYVGGDRQDIAPGSVGSRNYTGRLFRGDFTASPQWTPITSSFANPQGLNKITSRVFLPANGRLGSDAVFKLALGAGAPIAVTVPAANTQSNQVYSDLIENFNAALSSAGLGALVQAELLRDERYRGVLVLSTTAAANGAVLHLSNVEFAEAMYNLGFRNEDGLFTGTSPHPDSRAIVVAGGNLWEADDGGVYQLHNPGDAAAGPPRQWVSKNGDLRITEVYSAVYDPINNAILVAAQDNGAAAQWDGQDNNGDNVIDDPAERFFWSATLEGDGSTQAVQVVDAHTVERYAIANSFNTGVRITVDDHNQPQPTRSGGIAISNVDRSDNGPLVLNAVGADRILVADDKNLLATPAGTASGSSEDVQLLATLPQTITALAFGGYDPSGAPRPDVIYAAAGSRVFVNYSGQAQPFQSTQIAGAGEILDIALSPDDWHVAYAVDGKHVYKTANGGLTWANVTANLGGGKAGSLRAVATVKTISGVVVLVGGGNGLYRALDNQWIWTKLAGLPNVPISDLQYMGTEPVTGVVVDKLIVGTFGRGAWSLAGAGAKLAPRPS